MLPALIGEIVRVKVSHYKYNDGSQQDEIEYIEMTYADGRTIKIDTYADFGSTSYVCVEEVQP